jgi:hypothetical protein
MLEFSEDNKFVTMPIEQFQENLMLLTKKFDLEMPLIYAYIIIHKNLYDDMTVLEAVDNFEHLIRPFIAEIDLYVALTSNKGNV